MNNEKQRSIENLNYFENILILTLSAPIYMGIKILTAPALAIICLYYDMEDKMKKD